MDYARLLRLHYEIDEIEAIRQECANRVNPSMECSEKKEFALYVMKRQHVFNDAMQQAWYDLYENFKNLQNNIEIMRKRVSANNDLMMKIHKMEKQED